MEKQTFIQFCKDNGHRVTTSRLAPFDILKKAKEPMGAYEVLVKMKANGPPTAYRALDFLVMHGFAHNIGQRYVLCAFDEPHHNVHFLMCQMCGSYTELDCPEGIVYAISHGICKKCKRRSENKEKKSCGTKVGDKEKE